MIIFSFLLISLISLLALRQTFTLALFGDDWLAFWRYLEVLGPNSTQGYNHLSYFLTLYGPQDILMGGVLRPVFGFDSSSYYLTSYIFRLMASFSLYPLIFYLTKSRLSAFFGCLFFSITVVGFDTTNWVFNMPSYLSVACFNLYLYFLIRMQEGKKYFFSAGLLLYLAFILAPIRMTGAIPVTLAILIFQTLQKQIKIKKLFIFLGYVLLVFILAAFGGESFGPVFYSTGNFPSGLNKIQELISTNRADFILNPLVIFGGIIIPDFILDNYGNVLRRTELLLTVFLPIFLLFGLVILVVQRNASIDRRFLPANTVSALALNIFVMIYYPYYVNHFAGIRNIIYILVSGYVFILSISLLFFIKNKLHQLALFVGISLPIISYLYPWWRVPDIILETSHRYLIVAASGVSILLSSLIALGKSLRKKMYLSLIIITLLTLNYFALNKYLNTLNASHGQEISNKIWAQIPYYPEIKSEKGPFLLYFVGDGTNGNILHNVITFGLPPNMSLKYDRQLYTVLPMDNYEELLEGVKTGESLKRHGQVVNPVPINHIYSLKLEGKDKIIDQTEEIRKRILEDLSR